MQNDIFNRIENSKKIDFGDVISKSFELYKTHFSQGLIHTLIVIALAIPFMLIIYVPLIPMYAEMIQNGGNPNYQPEFFEDISIAMILLWYVLIFVVSFLMQLVSISVFGHFYKLLKKEDLKTNEDIGGYFTILKNHFGKILLLSLATFGIAVLAAVLCYLPIFYVIIPLHWILPIFVFNENLSVSDTIKAAFKYGTKNWLIFAGLGIVCSLMGSLGMLACYIGIIATAFFTYIATYVTYRDSIGFDNDLSTNDEPKQIEN